MSSVARGLRWSLAGSLTLRLGSVAVGIVGARLIAPADYGVFAVALTIWAVLGTLAEFGLGAALVRAEDPERAAPTVATVGLLTSCLLAAGVLLAAEPLAAAFRSPESTGVIRLMALAFVVSGLGIVPAARLQRDYRQAALTGAYAGGLAASLLTLVVLATQGAGPAALAWAQLANQGAILVAVVVLARRPLRYGLNPAVARETAVFCVPLALANLASWALLSVDNAVVARALGPLGLGLYVIAFNISSWPMSAVGQALRAVALPAFAQAGSPRLRNTALVRTAGPTVAVAVLMALGLATLAEPLIRVVYGDRWAPAAGALAGLAVFGGLRVMLDLIATFLIAVGDTAAVLLVQLAWVAALVPAMVVGVRSGGIAGAGWAHVLVALGLVLPLYAVCLRRAGVDVGAFFRGWAVPVAAALPAALICGWLGARSGSPLGVLFLGAAAAAAAYALPLAPWWWGRVHLLRRLEPAPTERTRA